MYAEVQSTHQLTPDILRVVLAGGTLDEFEGSTATDAYINARFVPQDSPVTVPYVADDLDWHLLVGDESAFGAIGATLESLAPGARAEVFALVERPGCELDFPSEADVAVRWLYRENAADPESLLVESIADSALPAGTFDVFVHGEAGEIRAVRRHLVDVRRIDPPEASISAYWRRNHTDEAWRAVKRQFMSDHSAAR